MGLVSGGIDVFRLQRNGWIAHCLAKTPASMSDAGTWRATMSEMSSRIRLMRWFIATICLLVGAGCGSLPQTDFPSAMRTADGQVILLDDVDSVVNDPNPNLDDDDRRQLLRDLGIEDEKLIDALLNL